MFDLPLTIPASPRVQAITARRLAQLHPVDCRPRVEAALADALIHGHVLALVQGSRTKADQRRLFAKGRKLEGGRWVVVDRSRVVTNARTLADTAHACVCDPEGTGAGCRGCALAADWAFAVDGELVGPRPGKGNDSWDADLPWKEVALILERHGLVSGMRFGESAPGAMDGFDLGHVEVPEWRRLRRER